MIVLILSGIIGIPMLISLLTYTLFCYEESNRTGQGLNILGKLAVRAAVQSILSEVLILISFPVGLWPKLWQHPQPGSGPIVVLMHGLFHNPSAWIVFRYWLLRQGLTCVCLGYSSWGARDFDQTTRQIREQLEDIVQKNPDREIHLIGHSLGGLLLRAALAEFSACTNIKNLITLGTPFQGSKLAPFALNSLGRYLWYNSATITATAALPFPSHIPGHALWSPADNMVLPHSALWCKILGWKNHATPAISHVAMLHSAKIFQKVLNIIQSASIRAS